MSAPRGIRPIRRLAIANRGEAAVRCIRAVKTLRESEGSRMECLALYTGPDRRALFVRQADRAVRLADDAGAVAAYLDRDALVDRLLREEADAVWPGWGFLAEDAEFVERTEEAGIRFLGPTGAAIRAVGDKIRAKHVAEAAGVPVVPWSGGEVANAEEAGAAAAALGYPVALKASAGGGGRGIRMLASPDALAEAFRGAAAEARSAFGDDRLFVERRIAGGRHVEIQIVADEHGTVLALGGRDCSVQRRHQKLLEEAPPPGLAPRRLAELEEAACTIARKVGYRGVGTVEFLVTPEASYFLELNPRLQVEHGVTEAVTGWDLVQWQIRIARGEALPSEAPATRGVAIEARVCAEDPDADFMPAPGRVARFAPALGPGLRIDTGIATGGDVPAEFDSLVAKVIAHGEGREQALGRLRSGLTDLDLVVASGASNKGFLLGVLASDDVRAGPVDTTWLDRFLAERRGTAPFAVEALVAAAVLVYQRARAAARANFYADASDISPDRVPPSNGQVVDLVYRGEAYRVEVYAVGGWGYRVHLDGRALFVTFEEEDAHTGRLSVGESGYHVVHDASGSDLRVEIDGHPHRFGRDLAGQVRAGTPAMVVALNVKPGDAVARGDTLGVLEAMKTEIRFEAPVAGVVKEVTARVGAQVAAGDVLLVIEPAGEGDATFFDAAPRLALPEVRDPLEPLYADGGAPDLLAADRAPAAVRRQAFGAVRTEVRRVLLGYDANPARADRLAEFLETPIPAGLSEAFRWRLAEIRHELAVFADVEQLFIRSRRTSMTGSGGPSNRARLRMFVRRMHASGAGLHDEYLALVERALSHYGVTSLEAGDALERAVLRLLATQKARELRHRLVRAALTRVIRLARAGVHMGDDAELRSALEAIVAMRGLVSDGLADAALEARYQVFERPEIEGRAERTSKQVEGWLDAAEADPLAPPGPVLAELAVAPRTVFDRVGAWVTDEAPSRRSVALSAHLLRLYHPWTPRLQTGASWDDAVLERIELSDGRVVVAAASSLASVPAALSRLSRAAGVHGAAAAELFVAGELAPGELERVLGNAAGADIDADRLTVGQVREGGPDHFETLVRNGDDRFVRLAELHGVHPEVAERIELSRLSAFDLERLEAEDGIYAFRARAKEAPSDERLIVLADVHGAGNGPEAAPHIPVFERMFHAAARTLRQVVQRHDPKRRLQWNRIALFVAPALVVDQQLASDLSRRLAPATRHLGLEKVLVRLRLFDTANPVAPPATLEIEITETPGARMDLRWREPRTRPLEVRSAYERRVGEARRRGLVEPYEIVRMLCDGGRTGDGDSEVSLPPARFEEYDLAPDEVEAGAGASRLRAVSVEGRDHGQNQSGVVFGILSTPTEKVPEGMRRVLVLSDPTRHMGALAAGECDRIVAALDLAEAHGLPVEWVPVSSGARIAMDSGTENLDATARVVRRIVEFTDAGHTIHVIVDGVNVGAQSYFDALATMGTSTRGALIMTPRGSMVLTGRAALAASGGVSAEDEVAIGGFERVMGPNGEAQYLAQDLADAYRILYEHYRYSYVVPGEDAPRPWTTADPTDRDFTRSSCADPSAGFATVGDLFDDASNPGRKAPFAMRDVMAALVDADGGHLERWSDWVGAETAITWDAHLGGHAVTVIGIESQPTRREGYRPLDGPEAWSGGTLFPLSSKKVARSLAAASGVRPVVVLANLSGFDGSPESMRKLQLEYGAQIARAVVNFCGPILFVVVSRYHGGAYVVFSGALNRGLRPMALAGSYASVIGGGPAAAVVFPREVRARAAADPRVTEAEAALHDDPSPEARARFDQALSDVLLEKQSEMAAEFDAIHTVERAREVGSLESIVDPRGLRPLLVRQLDEARGERLRSR